MGDDVVTERRLHVTATAVVEVAEVQGPCLAAVVGVGLVHRLRQDAQAAGVEGPRDLASQRDRLLEELERVDGGGPGVDLRLPPRPPGRLEVDQAFTATRRPLNKSRGQRARRRVHPIGGGVVVDHHEAGRSRARRNAGVTADDGKADW